MIRVFAIVVLAIIGGAAWYSMWQPLYDEGHKLATWIPIEVTRTTDTKLQQGHPTLGGVSSSTAVAVTYQYKVGDKKIILPPRANPPIDEISPEFQQRAKEMEEALRNGRPLREETELVTDKVTAYVNPAKPEDLYFHHPPHRLLFLRLLPLVLLTVGVAGLMLGQPLTHPQVPKMSSNRPWRQLLLTRSRLRPVIDYLILAVIWAGMVAFVCRLYFRVYAQPPTEAYVSAVLFGLPAFAFLMLATLHAWAIVTLGQPRVYLDVPYLTCDETFRVRLVQPVRRWIRLRRLRIGLLCMKEHTCRRVDRTVRGFRPDFQDFSERTFTEPIDAGTMVEFEETFHVPLDAEPSTPPQAWDEAGSRFYMRHFSWYIRIEVKLSRLPSFSVDFPVRVQ